jgi:cysteine desulfurase
VNTAFLDHNATSPLDRRVLEAMLPYLQGQHGNPSSRHAAGRAAQAAVEDARERVAAAAGAHPSQVVLTSGGTEADNLAVQGICAALKPSQIVVSAVEHPAVMRPAQAQLGRGWKLARIAVDTSGRILTDSLRHALHQPTGLVSVMLANNETGVLHDLPAIAELTKQHGAIIHTDAVQALGKVKVDFRALGIHAMSLSAHKIGGPQGAGALVLDKHVDIRPLLYGGGQEKGLRSGSENVAAIVGFGAACQLVQQELASRMETMRSLRDRLERGLHALGATIFGEHADRLPNTSFFALPDIDGETLVMALDRQGFAVASGSACSSDSTEPSAVLLAMGVDGELARSAVRVSFSACNMPGQVNEMLTVLRAELLKMKRMAAIAV